MTTLAEWLVDLLTDEYYSDCPILGAQVVDPTTIRLTLRTGDRRSARTTTKLLRIEDEP